jgi:tRNA G46 methylase TrmB
MHEAESLSAEIADLYVNGQYPHSNPYWFQNDSPWKARQILQMMTRNAVAARSVCEIGCGAGEMLASLQRQLPPDTCFKGFEPSPHAFQIAARRLIRDFRL